MKKILILTAIAALAASAACTKNTVDSSVQDELISFQVANYTPMTRANSAFGGTEFKTYAWFHPTDGANSVVSFMNNETVSLHDGTTAFWAPARNYFWPKTGYVNFYSSAYSGTANKPGYPTSVSEAVASGASTATVTYGVAPDDNGTPDNDTDDTPATYVEIANDADVLLASAAFRYSRLNWNDDSYAFTYGTNNTNVTGVPTLFHHMLSKVKFIVKFDATAGSASDKWELTVNSAALNYSDHGYLVINFADTGDDDNITSSNLVDGPGLREPYTSATVGWVPQTGSNKNLAATGGLGSANKQTQYGIDGSTASISTGVSLFTTDADTEGFITVMPQTLATTSCTFTINYTLAHTYSTEPTITETVNLPAFALTTFTSSDVTAWNMNQRYIYTVTIKPDHTVTFSPAVENWADPDINTGYTWPAD